MADSKHLEILEKGVEFWNEWRTENRKIKPDLSCANLRGENLAGVDFSYANLNSANLSDTNLSDANLWGADLSYSKLIYANLNWAILTDVNFNQAYLDEADFSYANLRNIKNFTIRQISKVKSLHRSQIDPELMVRMSREFEYLFYDPGVRETLKPRYRVQGSGCILIITIILFWGFLIFIYSV